MSLHFTLKPCPFCGGKAVFKVLSYFSNRCHIGVDYTIKCSKCGCSPFENHTRAEYFISEKDGGIVIDSKSQLLQMELVEKWNNRHTEKGGVQE